MGRLYFSLRVSDGKCRTETWGTLVRAILFFLTFALSGIGGGRAIAAEPDDQERGQRLVSDNCGRCHAVGLEGKSTHEKAPPFREVVGRYPLDNLEEALAEGIMSGHPDMPEFTFKPGEIAAILAYFQTLKDAAGGKTAAPTAKP